MCWLEGELHFSQYLPKKFKASLCYNNLNINSNKLQNKKFKEIIGKLKHLFEQWGIHPNEVGATNIEAGL